MAYSSVCEINIYLNKTRSRRESAKWSVQQQEVLLLRCTFAMKVQALNSHSWLDCLNKSVSLAPLLSYTDELILTCQKVGGSSRHKFSRTFISPQLFCKVCCRQPKRVRVVRVGCAPATHSPWKLSNIFWHNKQTCHRNMRY